MACTQLKMIRAGGGGGERKWGEREESSGRLREAEKTEQGGEGERERS